MHVYGSALPAVWHVVYCVGHKQGKKENNIFCGRGLKHLTASQATVYKTLKPISRFTINSIEQKNRSLQIHPETSEGKHTCWRRQQEMRRHHSKWYQITQLPSVNKH